MQMAMAKKETCCGYCIKKVGVKDPAMGCDWCQDWIHIECCYISKELYENIRKSGDSLKWFCRKCNPKVGSLMKEIRNMQAKVDKIEADLSTKKEQVGLLRE